jgi:hypothetical protein
VEYAGRPDQPRILTLDCDDELVEAVKAAGFNVEVGYTGFFEDHPMQLPERLHELIKAPSS